MRKPTPLIWHLIPSYLLIILVSLGGVTWFALTSLQTFSSSARRSIWKPALGFLPRRSLIVCSRLMPLL